MSHQNQLFLKSNTEFRSTVLELEVPLIINYFNTQVTSANRHLERIKQVDGNRLVWVKGGEIFKHFVS